MLATVALVTVLTGQVAEADVPMTGTSGGFQKTYYEAVSLLEQGKFSQAQVLAKRLPSLQVTIEIDYKGVDPARRLDFQKQAKDAVAAWKLALPELKATFAKKGDIKISFVPTLPKIDASSLPQGLVTFVSDDPAEPRLEAVVAVKRLSPPVSIEAPVFGSEMVYLVGSYFGLERDPRPGSTMGRMDGLGGKVVPVDMQSAKIARANLSASDKVRAASTAKKKLRLLKPEAFVSTTTLDGGLMHQGTAKQMQFDVVNRGNGPLKIEVRPDCSCFLLNYPGVVQPGEATVVSVLMDTTQFMGPQSKNLVLYTNDPENPFTVIHVKGNIQPAYRFLRDPGSRDTVYVEDNGATVVFYLAVDPAAPIKVINAQVAGVSGVATFEPWSGNLADPDMNQPEMARQGYKVTVLLSPTAISGRVPVNVAFGTDSPVFRVLNHTFFVQRGFAVSPSTLYMGDIGTAPTMAWLTVSRPYRPFTILSSSCEEKAFTVKSERLPNGDYKVSVAYDGKAKPGMLLTKIILRTDDKDNPVIEIPLQATVK